MRSKTAIKNKEVIVSGGSSIRNLEKLIEENLK